MGKTFLLLIAIFSCLGAEYVKSLAPVRTEPRIEQNSSEFYKIQREFLRKDSKNSALKNAEDLKNSKSKKQAEHKAQNLKKIDPKTKTQIESKTYKKANLADFTNLKNSEIVTGQKSDEYIFWAKFFTTNQMLSTRIIAFSKAMQKSDESDFKLFCKLKTPRFKNQSEIEYFKANEEALADCFTKSPFYALEYSRYKLEGAKLKTNLKTNITQIPVRFIAIFKGQGAIILAKTTN